MNNTATNTGGIAIFRLGYNLKLTLAPIAIESQCPCTALGQCPGGQRHVAFTGKPVRNVAIVSATSH